MREFKHILFDLDGTLSDPGEGIIKSIEYSLSEMGEPVPTLSVMRRFIGPPLTESFQHHCAFDYEKAIEATRLFRERYAEKGIYENFVYPGVKEMLYSLQSKGKRLYIATSKPTVFAEKIIDFFNMKGYFSGVCGSEMDNSRSKKTEIVDFVLRKFLSGEEASAVMVGDREHDMLAASNCGIVGLGVTYGYGSRDELEKAGAYCCFDEPGLLADWLMKETV